jgi:hypothetical protein
MIAGLYLIGVLLMFSATPLRTAAQNGITSEPYDLPQTHNGLQFKVPRFAPTEMGMTRPDQLVANLAPAASPKRKSSPIQIVWSNSTEDIVMYKVSAAGTDRVKLQLISFGRTIDNTTKAWAGGIDDLLAVAERASREARSIPGKSTKGKYWRRLTVSYRQGVTRSSFSFEGQTDELFAFFYRTTDLRALLTLVSADGPKAYRLINEGREFMRPPEGRKN